MRRRLGHFILTAAVLLVPAEAEWIDTPTGIDLNKLHQFPLSKIRSGRLKSGTRVAFDGITATADSVALEVRLRGVGVSDKRWEARMCSLDEVWRGDLDGNGTLDYVFFGIGPYGKGRIAPPFSLSILLMDAERLPVPFFTTVYRGDKGQGIKHLVDLEDDGRAELLISTYDEAPSDARVGPFCSGHWTTQLYRFNDLGAEEFRGELAGLKFPFVHASRDRRCPTLEKPLWGAIRHPTFIEHGTSRTNEVTTSIRDINEHGIAIHSVSGCKAIEPATVVYDTAGIRKIGFPSPYSDYNSGLLDSIMRHRVRVKLRGIRRMGDGNCSVNLVWAGE